VNIQVMLHVKCDPFGLETPGLPAPRGSISAPG